VPIDDAFRAWTSGNLEDMLKAARTNTHPVDRHFLLQSIVSESYKRRKEDRYRQLCIEYAEKHLQEFPSLFEFIKEGLDGFVPRVPTFQHYATVLTEAGEYEKAIEVCKKAILFGLSDNTQSGFRGRIQRIKKRMARANR